MENWPEFDNDGDLPAGVHRATLPEVLDHFGRGNIQRRLVARRLERIYAEVLATGHVARFVIFGSFVTGKRGPGDVDIFLLMDDGFDVSEVSASAVVMFDHLAAQTHEGASIFWMRKMSALGGEEAAVEHWQITRSGAKRGIVEVIRDDTE